MAQLLSDEVLQWYDQGSAVHLRLKIREILLVVALLLCATGCWVKLLEGRPNPSLSAYRSKNVPVKVCDPEKHLFRFNAQAVNSSL